MDINNNKNKILQLRILHWNADGLSKDVPELEQVMHKFNIHVALLSETHLTKNKKLTIKGYNIYRTDRIARHAAGGTAIIVDTRLPHTFHQLEELLSLEATAITITLDQGGSLRLVAAYNRPSNTISITDLKTVLNTGMPTVLAGDLNCKSKEWGCKADNQNGRRLFEHIYNETWTLSAPTEPTHYPWQGNQMPDILDIALVNNFDYDLEQKVLGKLYSDHRPVLMTIKVNNIQLTTPMRYWGKLQNF